ncbi:hypothetical protein SUGI_0198470 [Cryptomeria japonica]|nr:hypothetical protein SUGI_0198470 [Cryptomeria japonica]
MRERGDPKGNPWEVATCECRIAASERAKDPRLSMEGDQGTTTTTCGGWKKSHAASRKPTTSRKDHTQNDDDGERGSQSVQDARDAKGTKCQKPA